MTVDFANRYFPCVREGSGLPFVVAELLRSKALKNPRPSDMIGGDDSHFGINDSQKEANLI